MDKNLIFDLGLHKGEDTKHYLKRGFKVVAIEANEELVKLNQNIFSEYLKNGKLVIINGAISDAKTNEITFYKNKKKSVWGTVVKDMADRNDRLLGAESIEIKVKVIKLKDLFAEYGVPYYLKIDIEGMDLFALKTLLDCETRPKYVSIESTKVDFNQLVEEFNVFEKLGYGEFKLIQQAEIHKQKIPSTTTEGKFINFNFEKGSSGLFGSDLSGEWISRNKAIKKYKYIFYLYRFFGDNSIFQRYSKVFIVRIVKALLVRLFKTSWSALPGWYDTHAKLKLPVNTK